ncbi:LysR family transcriptional regulator [Parablautia intestinalis]|uniref:LysR family transcriptional regulator n=1 Tax=Parablautia intestinalis TaxID=2320100 RepID=A0A3A9AQP0_9FIRM|nr:LysR family transcriptional regulator [Parablautia intestinalis]RKI89901.1 LysR family transcriptional regulator [Parablautia intestinalis]
MLKQLKYFMSVVDCNSFTEAAEQCFISQSAISQQISTLEQDLGVLLIKRQKRKFSLTPAGEYLYHESRGLLEQAEAIRRETVRIGQNAELRLRIGYLEGYEGKKLQEAIYEFTAAYPEVVLSVTKYSHEDLYLKVSNDEIDLVLSYQRRAFQDQYENYHLQYVPCLIEISTHNKLAQQSFAYAEEIKEILCILIAKKEQRELERIFYQNTLGIGRHFYFVESADDARLSVIGNRGFHTVADIGLYDDPPGLKRLPLLRGDHTPIELNYCAFWKKEKSNYYIEEFASVFKKKITEGK